MLQVYQGILSRYSEVFSDMFTLPQPSNAETLDGCHFIHLDDSPEDVKCLLLALFNSASR